jgi:hypothetical protein
VLDHPMEDRFGEAAFAAALSEAGFKNVRSNQLGGWFAWFVAEK